jgi:hypothetical protein
MIQQFSKFQNTALFEKMRDDGNFTKEDIVKNLLKPGKSAEVLLDFIGDDTKTELYNPSEFAVGSWAISNLLDDTVEAIDESALKLKTNVMGNGYTIPWYEILEWIDAFDTGGYTGSWGPEGKMAMLH